MKRLARCALLLALTTPIIGARQARDLSAHPGSHRSSPVTVSSDGRLVAAVNPDSRSVSLLDAAARSVTEIATGRNPQTVTFSADGTSLFVTNRDDHTVTVVRLPAGQRSTIDIPLCREPFGVVADGDRLYVSCFAASKVAVIDAASMRLIATIDVEIDPRGLALSSDGASLYVTHFTTGNLSVIDTAEMRIRRVIATLADSNLAQSIFIDLDTRLAYLPQTRSNAANPALLFDTTVFPIVSVIDLTTETSIASKRISVDIADRPVGIPIDAVRAGNRLFIVHAASNDLSVIDLATGRAVARFAVGASPRGLAMSPDHSMLYVNNTLDGTVTVIDAAALRVVETIRITTIPLSPRLLNGKRLFNSSADERLSKDRWIACATCHFDGGMDRRTWFFRDGPRNTPTLFGIESTGPFHWSGDLDELEDVESTIRLIQAGTGLTTGEANCDPTCDQAPPNRARSQDLDDLAAFTASLRFLPRRRHTTDEAAARGREIFFDPATRCASCHPPPLFTDRLRHDVGTVTATQERKGPLIDTPTLVGVADTAPYLHDGSAATLRDVLLRDGLPRQGHGEVSHLDERGLRDLLAFVETIGPSPGRRHAVRH